MALEVGKLYFVNLKYPGSVDDHLPAKAPPTHTVDAAPSTIIRTGYGCVGLLLHDEEQTQIGVIFLGTGNPMHPHRFVSWYGTERLPHQPQQSLEPDPLETFYKWPRHLNFSHAVQVKVVWLNDPIFPTTPDMALVREMIVDDEIVNSYVRSDQIRDLKTLHANYWMGTVFFLCFFPCRNSDCQPFS
jgi:hypothetical protein